MKISIVTPSYNQGRFIQDTFNSILSQKLNFGLEYIVADGGSTDETNDIIKKYRYKFRKKNIRFKYISEKDDGQADAVNKGWKISKGEIISYLNSDDYYKKNILNRVVGFFEKNPDVKWAYGGWNYVDENGNFFKNVQPRGYSYATLLNYCNISQPSCFYRRELIEEFGMLNKKMYLTMDYDLWLRFAQKYQPGIMNFTIANMRYYSGTKSGSSTMQHLIDSFRLNTKYTKPLSLQRLIQLFYFLRGFIVVILKKDITRRISSNKRNE